MTYKNIHDVQEHTRTSTVYQINALQAFGQSEEWCLHATNYLNCALLQFPFCYLGIPIGVNPKRKVVWDPIIRKFEDRLNRWKMGRGDQMLFSEDGWAEDGIPLKDQFPERQKLMHLQSRFKLIEVIMWVEKGWEWNFKWRRHLFDRELEMADCFLNDVAGSCIQIHKKDEWIWKIDPTGQYSERLQTKTNLRRRRVAINDTLCPFCGNSEENEAHVFLTCDRILLLWWESMTWVNIHGAFLQKPWQHFSQHAFCLPSRIRLNRWISWWLALTWTVW
ncbi:hypothetical protein GmHk_19G054670 [Glycine max]|nr:hypothetical protein GmHk_19G054670 [Glycine max]